MDECIYSCQHPVWGGAGVCLENNDGVSLDGLIGGDPSFCLCEDGFVSRDSYGEPSCVRAWIQLLVYTTAATVQCAGALFLAWHAARHRKLPASVRNSRRAKLRLRLSISSSVASTCFAVVCSVGVVRASTGYLLKSQVVPVLLVFCTPVGSLACSFGIELWIDSLPQVLAADSLEARLKHLAEEKGVFVWAGITGAVSLAVLLGTILVFLDVQTAMSVNDKIVCGVSLSTGLCIVFLGVRIGRIISRAEAQARLESKAFYSKARKKVSKQVIAIFGACVLFAMIVGANDFVPQARWTPVFLVASNTTVATSAFVMVTHFSRPNLSSVRALPAPAAAAYVYVKPAPGTGSRTQTEAHKKVHVCEPC